MKNLRLKYTANFKRDYVAGAAVAMFFMIVISELFLAVWLPLYMRRESALATKARRLHLIESFDAVRNQMRRVTPKDRTAKAEMALLMWNTDLMADYLREYAQYLSSEDVAALQQQLNEFSAAANYLMRGKPYSREQKLDCTPFLEQIMKKSGVGNVR
ncbi:MAG: hypothetical protein IKA87_05315 [Lentisphaeria bacterium]|nr:hypothetical protein [Lentisphaeria bacterium]